MVVCDGILTNHLTGWVLRTTDASELLCHSLEKLLSDHLMKAHLPSASDPAAAGAAPTLDAFEGSLVGIALGDMIGLASEGFAPDVCTAYVRRLQVTGGMAAIMEPWEMRVDVAREQRGWEVTSKRSPPQLDGWRGYWQTDGVGNTGDARVQARSDFRRMYTTHSVAPQLFQGAGGSLTERSFLDYYRIPSARGSLRCRLSSPMASVSRRLRRDWQHFTALNQCRISWEIYKRPGSSAKVRCLRLRSHFRSIYSHNVVLKQSVWAILNVSRAVIGRPHTSGSTSKYSLDRLVEGASWLKAGAGAPRLSNGSVMR